MSARALLKGVSTTEVLMATLTGLLFMFTAALTDVGFVPIGGRDGVDVYQRQGAALIELAAVGEFDAPPDEVRAALLDYGAHPRFNKFLAQSAVIARHANDLLVYQHLKLPVIADRDFTLRVAWTEGSTPAITFRIDGASGPAATSKAVRMTILNGRWDLEPIRGGTATRAVYHLQIDFAGSVPRWMVRGGAAKDIPGVFIGMRKLVGERREARVASQVASRSGR
jgi:hypothetical protein